MLLPRNDVFFFLRNPENPNQTTPPPKKKNRNKNHKQNFLLIWFKIQITNNLIEQSISYQ